MDSEGATSLAAPSTVRCTLRQSHGGQPVTELNDDVLFSFMYPGRHAIPGGPRNLHSAQTFSGALVDREEVRGAVTGLTRSEEERGCHGHRGVATSSRITGHVVDSLQEGVVTDGFLLLF